MSKQGKRTVFRSLVNGFLDLQRLVLYDIWHLDFSQFRSWKRWLLRLTKGGAIVIRGFLDDDCVLRATSLTYYTVLSFIPLIAVAASLATGFNIGQDRILSLIDAIPVQSPGEGAAHDAGRPLPIRWNKAPVSAYPTVDILLVDAQNGQVRETIKSGAGNTGAYLVWSAPQTYAWPGTSYMIKIVTPDNKLSGQSGVFTIVALKEKKKVPFILDAKITNRWAYARGGDPGPHDCLSAPQVQAGRQPGSHEVKIGHFVKEAAHGECRYYDEYYFRSRLTFDISELAGKEIVEAALMIRQGDAIELYPPGNNSEVSRRCDIYRLDGPWPASPQPLYDFYPGTLLTRFSLFGENETANIDLLNVVRDWAVGQANHGLMLRGPVNRSQYAPSASVNYYHSVKLVGWYLE